MTFWGADIHAPLKLRARVSSLVRVATRKLVAHLLAVTNDKCQHVQSGDRAQTGSLRFVLCRKVELFDRTPHDWPTSWHRVPVALRCFGGSSRIALYMLPTCI